MTAPASNRLQRLATRIDALNLRERAMLTAILVLLVWAGWQTLLMAPLAAERKSLSQRAETARTSAASLNTSIQTLAQQRARDPLAEQKLKLDVLGRQRAQLDGELAKVTSSLIDPQQMGAVLEDILAQQRAVKVIGLSSLAAEPMALGPAAAAAITTKPAEAAASGSTGLPPLYRHGMQLELEGSYLDLLGFLRSLDALPWEFIWTDLELSVEEPSRCRLRLTLHTLSLKSGWLGV